MDLADPPGNDDRKALTGHNNVNDPWRCGEPFEVVFVCTANRARSALAEARFRKYISGIDAVVRSAGTLGVESAPVLTASRRSISSSASNRARGHRRRRQRASRPRISPRRDLSAPGRGQSRPRPMPACTSSRRVRGLEVGAHASSSGRSADHRSLRQVGEGGEEDNGTDRRSRCDLTAGLFGGVTRSPEARRFRRLRGRVPS